MAVRRSTRKLDDGRGGKVSAAIHLPDGYDASNHPLLVLAHGAGAGREHPFMTTMQECLVERGVAVALFNFPYKEKGGRAPDHKNVLEGCYRAVANQLRDDTKLAPQMLVLGGKSMGGRIASQIVAQGYPADGLIFLGYPLHPPGKPDRLRKDHLPDIEPPMLFLQGTRDSLCRLDDLRAVLAELPKRHTLHVVEGGDHSFKVLKKLQRSEEDVFAELADTCAAWISARAK